MNLRVVTPAETPAVALAELVAHVNAEPGVDDGVLASYLASACGWAEEYTGRAVSPAVYSFSRFSFPRGREIWLPRPPLLELVSFTYRDEAGDDVEVDTETYFVDQSGRRAAVCLARGATWPDVVLCSPGLSVTYSAGYATSAEMPGPLLQGILMLAGHWYQTREAVVVGEAGMRAQEIPFGVTAAWDLVRLA